MGIVLWHPIAHTPEQHWLIVGGAAVSRAFGLGGKNVIIHATQRYDTYQRFLQSCPSVWRESLLDLEDRFCPMTGNQTRQSKIRLPRCHKIMSWSILHFKIIYSIVMMEMAALVL
jgi:hypothetical protein